MPATPNQSDLFMNSPASDAEDIGNGMRRKILGYDNNLMLVKVWFEKGAVGPVHAHPHTQKSSSMARHRYWKQEAAFSSRRVLDMVLCAWRPAFCSTSSAPLGKTSSMARDTRHETFGPKMVGCWSCGFGCSHQLYR